MICNPEIGSIRHKNIVDRHDGSFIFRFRVHNPLKNLKISVLDSNGNHFQNSPIIIDNLNHADCSCPTSVKNFLNLTNQLSGFTQIDTDLSKFKSISTRLNNQRVEKRFCKNPGQDSKSIRMDNPYMYSGWISNPDPGATSLCRYIIKENKVYRKCHGQHIGFNMFSDDILLQLTRMVQLPDVEFWMNLGDWPMQEKKRNS